MPNMAFVEQSLPLSELQVEEQLLQGHSFFLGGRSCRIRFPLKFYAAKAVYVCLMVFSLHEEVPDEELQECERMISQLESPSSKAEVGGLCTAADLFFHGGYSIRNMQNSECTLTIFD